MVEEKTRLLTVRNILDNYIIQLPSFQRSYTWTKNNVELFVNDILNNSKKSEYYIGVIYYVKIEKGKISIIDGQQRLTTLFLILNAIRLIDNKIIESENVSFFFDKKAKLDIESNSPFCNILLSCDSMDELKNNFENSRNLNFSKVNLFVNFNYILEILKHEDNLKSLTKSILVNLKMVFVDCKDFSSGSQIFENINSKGQELSNIDLIKNAYFSRISNKAGDKEYNSFKYLTWKEIENNFYPTYNLSDKVSNLKKINNTAITEFQDLFSIFLQLKHKKRYSKKSKELYLSYIQELNGYNQQQLRQEMVDLSTLSSELTYINRPFDKSIPAYEFIQRHIIFLKKFLGIKMTTPFLLSIINALEKNRYRENKKDINKLLIKMSVFHFIFNTVYSLRPSIIEKFYNDIAYEIYNQKINFKKLKEKFKKKYDDILKENGFKNLKNKLKKVLFTLERSNNKIGRIKGYKSFNDSFALKHLLGIVECYLKKDYGSIQDIDTVEHISNLANGGKEELSNFNLFNFLPLEQELNEKCGKKDLKDKIALYKKSNYKLTKEFCKSYDTIHNNDFIEQWQKFICDILVKIIKEDF